MNWTKAAHIVGIKQLNGGQIVKEVHKPMAVTFIYWSKLMVTQLLDPDELKQGCLEVKFQCPLYQPLM